MPLMRRRPLLRAAAVGGAAYYAGKKTQQRREYDADQDDRISDLEAQQQYGAPQQAVPQQAPMPQQAAPPAGAPDDLTSRLQQLASLHQQGALTDEEFAAARSQLLSG